MADSKSHGGDAPTLLCSPDFLHDPDLEAAYSFAEYLSDCSGVILGIAGFIASGHAPDQATTVDDGQAYDAFDQLVEAIDAMERVHFEAIKQFPKVEKKLIAVHVKSSTDLCKPPLKIAGESHQTAHGAINSIASHISVCIRLFDGNTVVALPHEPNKAINLVRLREEFTEACKYLNDQPYARSGEEIGELLGIAKREAIAADNSTEAPRKHSDFGRQAKADQTVQDAGSSDDSPALHGGDEERLERPNTRWSTVHELLDQEYKGKLTSEWSEEEKKAFVKRYNAEYSETGHFSELRGSKFSELLRNREKARLKKETN